MEKFIYVYSVFDNLAKRFGPLFEAINDEVATRSYIMMMDKVDERFKSEYSLHKIGKFDNNTGIFLPEDQPIKILVPEKIALKQVK